MHIPLCDCEDGQKLNGSVVLEKLPGMSATREINIQVKCGSCGKVLKPYGCAMLFNYSKNRYEPWTPNLKLL